MEETCGVAIEGPGVCLAGVEVVGGVECEMADTTVPTSGVCRCCCCCICEKYWCWCWCSCI